MKRGLLLVAVPLLLAAGAWPLLSRGTTGAASRSGPATYTVRRGDLDITIVENGTLVAKDSLKVVPQFRSEAKIVFLLEEGKSVQQGDVICRCDSLNLQNQVEQQEMEIVQAEAALVTARTEHEIQIGENQATIEKAKITLDLVRLELEKYRDGDAPQDHRALEVAIKDAETDFNRANKRYEDSKKLVEQNFVKRSELEQDTINLEKATVKLEASRRALQVFEQYTMPMTLRKDTNAVADATRDLDTAEKRANSKLNQREADRLQAETRIKRLRQQLADRRKDLDNMTMTAPCPGILIYGDPREPWYREQIKVGGSIYGGNTLMTIPDLRVMQVKIEVHEADINKVEVGQPVIVTMDTYPGLRLHGLVERVANIAAAGNPWSGTQTEVKRFDVEIVLKDTAERKLKPGISAKAEIQVATLRDALFVPLQCVFLEGGVHRCIVAGPDGPQRRDVKIGLSSDTYTEIQSGLEAGEQVLLHNPFLRREPGSDTTPGDAGTAAAIDASTTGKGAATPAALPAGAAAGAAADTTAVEAK